MNEDQILENLSINESRAQAFREALNFEGESTPFQQLLFVEGELLPALREVVQWGERGDTLEQWLQACEHANEQWLQACEHANGSTLVAEIQYVNQSKPKCFCPFCRGGPDPHYVRVLHVALLAAQAALEYQTTFQDEKPEDRIKRRIQAVLKAASFANGKGTCDFSENSARWTGDEPTAILQTLKQRCPEWSLAPVCDLIGYFRGRARNSGGARVSVTFPLDNNGQGVIAKLVLETVESGFGELYPDIEMLLSTRWDEAFQTSMQSVWKETAQPWRKDKTQTDVRFSFEPYRNENAAWKTLPVSGPSAGAAFGIGLDCLLNGKTPPELDWAITGGVDQNGKLTSVGGYTGKSMPFNTCPNLRLVVPKDDKKQVPADWCNQVVEAETLTNAYDYMTELIRDVIQYLEKLKEQHNKPPAYYPADITSLVKVRVKVRISEQRIQIPEEQARGEEGERTMGRAYSHRHLGLLPGGGQNIRIVDWDKEIRSKLNGGTIKRIVIVGDPGLGKTWLLKAELLHSIEQAVKTLETGDLDAVILPVFLRLQDLATALKTVKDRRSSGKDEAETLENVILEALSGMSLSKGMKQLIRQKIADKKCKLLLDSLDEVTTHREELLDKLRDWAADAPCALLTSRLVGYQAPWEIPEDKAKREQEGIWETELMPLGDEEIKEFITKFFESDKNAANDLNSLVLNGSSPHLKGMASIPILLSFICLLHKRNRNLPKGERKDLTKMRRSDLYGEIIWKILQGVWRINLLPDEQVESELSLLEHLAFDFIKKDKEQFTYRELSDAINASGRLQAGETAESKIKQLSEEYSILTKYGYGKESNYLFLHLTFQEYLAAAYLAKQNWDFICPLLETDRKAWEPRWQVGIALLGELLSDPEPLRQLLVRTIEYKNEDDRTDLPPLRVRIALAETLGEIGDPRFDYYDEYGNEVKDPKRKARIWRKEDGRWKECLVISKRVHIPATEKPFVMGTSKEDAKQIRDWGLEVYPDEQPAHPVLLSAYEIGRYLVTYREYEQFVENGGYANEDYWTDDGRDWLQESKQTAPSDWNEPRFHKPNYPVLGVNWYEAVAYCRWLSERMEQIGALQGGMCRLPSEAEWEYAARGMARRLFPWGDELLTGQNASRLCNASLGDDSVGRTTPVGIYIGGATEAGIFDLAGNLWELVRDVWEGDFYGECKKQGVVKDPECGKDKHGLRVLRGGSWVNFVNRLRAAYRVWDLDGYRGVNHGFRFVFPQDS